MEKKKGEVYRFFRIVKDNKKMGSLPKDLFVKMLKNINRSRVVAVAVDEDVDSTKKMTYTEELQEQGEKLSRHNDAAKAKLEGRDYKDEDFLNPEEMSLILKNQKDAIEKVNAYIKKTEDEKVEINIEKLTEDEYITYIEAVTGKDNEKSESVSMDDAAFLYDFLVP